MTTTTSDDHHHNHQQLKRLHAKCDAYYAQVRRIYIFTCSAHACQCLPIVVVVLLHVIVTKFKQDGNPF